MVELLDLESTGVVTVGTSAAGELRLVRIVILVARLTVGFRYAKLSGFLTLGGRGVALDARSRNVGSLERELSIAVVTLDVVFPGRPLRLGVAIVTSNAPGHCFERIPVIIEMAGSARFGDGMRIGELASRRSDRDADQPLARVPRHVADDAFYLCVLAFEWKFGSRVIEAVFDLDAPYSMPTRRRMTARTGAVELAPMLVFMTRFAAGEFERGESHVQLSLPGARSLVTIRTVGATMTAG